MFHILFILFHFPEQRIQQWRLGIFATSRRVADGSFIGNQIVMGLEREQIKLPVRANASSFFAKKAGSYRDEKGVAEGLVSGPSYPFCRHAFLESGQRRSAVSGNTFPALAASLNKKNFVLHCSKIRRVFQLSHMAGCCS